MRRTHVAIRHPTHERLQECPRSWGVKMVTATEAVLLEGLAKIEAGRPSILEDLVRNDLRCPRRLGGT